MVCVFLMLFRVPSSGSSESKWWRRGRSEATPTSPVGLYVFYIKHSWVRRACLHWAGCLALAQRRVWRGSAANSCYRESQADRPWRPQEPWTQTQGSAWSSSRTAADRAGHGTILVSIQTTVNQQHDSFTENQSSLIFIILCNNCTFFHKVLKPKSGDYDKQKGCTVCQNLTIVISAWEIFISQRQAKTLTARISYFKCAVE